MKILIPHKRDLHKAGKKLLAYAGASRIIAFYGSMGSGKTTIIKALCELLGAVDIISSPTFTLVNEYRTSGNESLYHIDLYRIRKTGEVLDFGIEEYLTGDNYCFLEWPELIESLLPEETLKVRITVGENDERILELP